MITDSIGDLAGIGSSLSWPGQSFNLTGTSMPSRPWYAFYPKDYQQKTSHLTFAQHGAYRLLLDHYYSTAKPLPANAEQLHRICRAFDDAEKAAINFVLHDFFKKTKVGYIQDRVQDELKKAEDLSETRRNAANSRYANAGANALQKHTQPHPHYTTTEVSKNGKGFQNDFVVGKNGNGNGFTVKDPQARLAKFQNWLAPKLGADLKDAWNVIHLASDPSLHGHLQAKETCRLVAIQHGKKGLPPQW